MMIYPIHPEDQATLDARTVVEEQFGSYEPNDDTPDCVFRKHEGDYGPCGGVTYSDSFTVTFCIPNGKRKFSGVEVPVPVCSAHYDVVTERIEKSNYVFNITKGK